MKLRHTCSTLVPAMALALAAPSYAQDDAAIQQQRGVDVARSNTQINLNEQLNDGQILQIVRTLNDAEIKQANEALDEADNEAVKQVAEVIISDHEAANEQMDELLDGDLDLDDSEMSKMLGEQGEETHELLQDLSGIQYECAYLKAQVSQHEMAIETAKSQLVPKTQNASVRDFLTAMEPKLQHHLQMAKDSMGQVEGCSASG